MAKNNKKRDTVEDLKLKNKKLNPNWKEEIDKSNKENNKIEYSENSNDYVSPSEKKRKKYGFIAIAAAAAMVITMVLGAVISLF